MPMMRRTWDDTDPIQKLCIWYSSLILRSTLRVEDNHV